MTTVDAGSLADLKKAPAPTPQPKPETAKEVLKFFDWAYSPDGDKLADALGYVPLPDAVTSQIKSTWKTQIKDTSGKPVY